MRTQSLVSQVGFAIIVGFVMLFAEYFLAKFDLWESGALMGFGFGVALAWIAIAIVNRWRVRPWWLSWLVPVSNAPESSDTLMRCALTSGRWVLCFRPDAPNRSDEGKKQISFMSNGDIGEGQNRSEWSWCIKGQTLFVNRKSGQLHNAFQWNKDTQRFESINKHSYAVDEDKIHGQYIEPFATELNTSPSPAVDTARIAKELLSKGEALSAIDDNSATHFSRVKSWMADCYHFIVGYGVKSEAESIATIIRLRDTKGASPAKTIEDIAVVRGVLNRFLHYPVAKKSNPNTPGMWP